MGKSSSKRAQPAPAPAAAPAPAPQPVLAPDVIDPGDPPMKQPPPAQVIQPAPGTRFAPDENSGKPEPTTTVRKRKSKGKQKTGKGLLAEGGNPSLGYSGDMPGGASM